MDAALTMPNRTPSFAQAGTLAAVRVALCGMGVVVAECVMGPPNESVERMGLTSHRTSGPPWRSSGTNRSAYGIFTLRSDLASSVASGGMTLFAASRNAVRAYTWSFESDPGAVNGIA